MEANLPGTNDAGNGMGALANGGQSNQEIDGQDSVRRIPATRIAALRRKKQGAKKRVATRERDVKALQAKLHSKAQKLSLSERRDLKHSILSIELELEQARDELRQHDAALTEALGHNNQIKTNKLADHRAERRLMSRVPSFIEDVQCTIDVELGVAMTGNGPADPIEAIVLSAEWDRFDSVLSSLIKENKPKLWKELCRFDSVKRAVYRNIWNEYERKDVVVLGAADSTKPSEEVQS